MALKRCVQTASDRPRCQKSNPLTDQRSELFILIRLSQDKIINLSPRGVFKASLSCFNYHESSAIKSFFFFPMDFESRSKIAMK